jgi:hypothetical protein
MTNLKKEFELLPELKKVINSLNETISKQKESNKYFHEKTVDILETMFVEHLNKKNT